MNRATWTAFALVILPSLWAFACGNVAGANHIEIAHCAEDPNASRSVDTADIAQFTGAFATTLERLDIAPELVGDGYVDTTDIAMVVAHFGEFCIGTTETDMMGGEPLDAESAGPRVWGCKFKTFGWYTNQPLNGQILVTDWGGLSHCFTTPYYPYTSVCTFAWHYLDNGEWHLIANTNTAVETAPSLYSGQNCDAYPGHPTWVPCGKTVQGIIVHEVHFGPQTGQLLHGPHYHGGGDGDFNDFFTVC